MITRMPASYRPLVAVAIGTGTFLVWHICINFMRLNSTFAVTGFDLGVFGQAMWRLLHDGHFWTTLHIPSKPRNILGEHFMPILFLMAPFYWVSSSPKTLVVLNTLGVTLGILPAYGIGLHWLKSPKKAAIAALSYLFNPLVFLAAFNLFAPENVAAAFYLGAIWALLTNRVRLHVVLLIFALSCRETIGLDLAMIGVMEAVFLGRKQLGMFIGGFGLLWFVVCIGWVEPWLGFRNPLGPLNVPSSGPFTHFSDVIAYLYTQKAQIIGSLVGSAKRRYLTRLFFSCGLLSVFSPQWLLPTLPALSLVLVLANRNLLSDLAPWYIFPIFPFFYVAALHTLFRWRLRQRTGLVCLAAGTILAYLWVDPIVAHQYYTTLHLGRTLAEKGEAVRAAQAYIPSEAFVSAAEPLVPFVCNRKNLSVFPDKWNEADMILLSDLSLAAIPAGVVRSALEREAPMDSPRDRDPPTIISPSSSAKWGWPSRMQRDGMDYYFEFVDELVFSGKYDLLFEDHGIMLFQRNETLSSY